MSWLPLSLRPSLRRFASAPTPKCVVEVAVADPPEYRSGFEHELALGRSIILRAFPVPSVQFKLSTGDWYGREVESEEAAIEQVKRFFDRHDEYLRDWIRVDGNAWIVRSAVVAVEVRADSEAGAANR